MPHLDAPGGLIGTNGGSHLVVYDVVVVGAGPAGTACARFCAESGLSVLCIEEHATIGHPVQCAGLLSRAAFEECRVSDRPVMNRVSGARVLSGRGSEILFDAGETKAYVVDRGALDREMAAAAAAAGAEFRVKTAFHRRAFGTIITRGIHGKEEIPYRMLIAADGPRGCVARAVAHGSVPPRYLAGIQAEVPHRMDNRFVELHPAASPDFFGWVIPAGPGRARVGLCGFTDVRERFATFLAPFGTDCVHLVTGTIPIGTMPQDIRSSHPFYRGCGRIRKTHIGRRGVYRGPVRPPCGRHRPPVRVIPGTFPTTHSRPTSSGGRRTSAASLPLDSGS